jgi:F-type H+-transporting ATPase subunit b
MIDVNYTLLIQVGIFILFVFLINHLLFRPVVKVLERRREATTGAQEKAMSLQEKAEREEAILEERLLKARQKAALERDNLRKEILAEQKMVIEQAKHSVEKDIPALKEKAVAEAGKVEVALKGEIDALAEKIVEKTLGRAA